MSANTAIKEGGNPHSFGPVDYLRVASGSDQYALWVPENERALTTKSITQNGIYRASDDGAYGWSSVYVNVPKPESVTGKDGDGDEVVVKPDPDTGVLEEEKVPSSIEITTPPTKLTYTDGETIDFTGAVVKAYYESGGEWGTVPNNEITLNPSVATYDASTAEEGYTEVNGSPFDAIDNLIPFNAAGGSFTLETDKANYNYVQGAGGSNIAAFVKGDSGSLFVQMVFASSSPFDFGASVNTYDHSGPPPIPPAPSTQAGSFTYNGKTVYYGYAGSSTSGKIVSAGMYNVSNIDVQNFAIYIAWSIIYGDTETHKAGSRQQITVSWPRPGDGAILETTFDITVQQSFGGASGGGGQAGETGAGRND